jgi:hypothetical protein
MPKMLYFDPIYPKNRGAVLQIFYPITAMANPQHLRLFNAALLKKPKNAILDQNRLDL